MADALSVISLQDAKDFLVIDFPDRDAEITRHIKAAIGYIERYTNVMMYSRSETYTLLGCNMEIYDYPITFTDTELKTKQHVLSVTVYGKEGDEVEATVGYDSVDDVPEQLIDAAYILISYLAENKGLYPAELPWDIQVLVNQHRRSASIL